MAASKEVSQILKKFKDAKTKRQEKDNVWKELDAFDRGEQWDLDGKLPAWVPKPVTNYIHLVKTTKRAALAMENATGKLRALSPTDVDNVDMLNKIYVDTWDRIGVRSVVRENIETAKLLGTGITQVYWDENIISGGTNGLAEGEIKVKEIDPASFYPDPTAFNIDECQFIHIVERKPIEWLKKHPIFGKGMQDVEETNVASEEQGEIYLREYKVSQDGLVDFHQHYEKVQNQEGGFTYKVTYIAGEKKVHEIEQLRPNRYPFAILYDFPQRQDFWGKGTCEYVLDNQKIVNKVESIMSMIGILMQNPQRIVSKRSGINPKEVATYGNAPGHTYTTNDDPTRSIHWLLPPQIPQALFNLYEQAKANVREIAGLNEAYMGQSVGSLQTSSGVEALIERSTLRDRDQMYDIEMYIKQLSEIIVDFITTNYNTPRYLRHIEHKNGEEITNFISYVGTGFQNIEYDFSIDVSARAPISRMREQNEAKELLNMQGQFQFNPSIMTPQEYLDVTNPVHKDRIKQRMNIEEMQNEVQETMQVVSMALEAQQSGVSSEEIQNMVMAMVQQMEQNPGMGNVAQGNANQFQQRQGG